MVKVTYYTRLWIVIFSCKKIKYIKRFLCSYSLNLKQWENWQWNNFTYFVWKYYYWIVLKRAKFYVTSSTNYIYTFGWMGIKFVYFCGATWALHEAKKVKIILPKCVECLLRVRWIYFMLLKFQIHRHTIDI